MKISTIKQSCRSVMRKSFLLGVPLVTQIREYCVLQMCLNYVNSTLMSSLTGIELRNTFQAPV